MRNELCFQGRLLLSFTAVSDSLRSIYGRQGAGAYFLCRRLNWRLVTISLNLIPAKITPAMKTTWLT